MQAGKLRHRITIQEPTSSPDNAGQLIRSWSAKYSSVPAELVEGSGGELPRGRQLQGEASVVFRIRNITDITTEMRVIFEGRTLGIQRVRRAGNTRQLTELICGENVD